MENLECCKKLTEIYDQLNLLFKEYEDLMETEDKYLYHQISEKFGGFLKTL